MRALIIGPVSIPSFEIGILQPFRYLKRQGIVRYRAMSADQVTNEHIDMADVVIFYRTDRPETYSLFEYASSIGKRTVYAIDDHFLALPVTADYRHHNDPQRRLTFVKFLKNAQLIRVASPYFGDHIRTHFNPNVVYFPSSVDFRRLDKLKKPNRDDGKVVIGYEGGRKEAAFAPVVPALKRILDKYGNKVKMEFIGYVPSGIKDHPNVSCIVPNESYRTFMRRLYKCTWNIGLAPLHNTLFNRCKTNNKFRDYSACWIPGIYSESPAYANWVTHKETGYLVPQTVDGWYNSLREMIENPSLRSRIKRHAGQMAREQLTIEGCADNWRKHILHL